MSQTHDFDPTAFGKSAVAELRRELLDFSTRDKLLSFKHWQSLVRARRPSPGGDARDAELAAAAIADAQLSPRFGGRRAR